MKKVESLALKKKEMQQWGMYKYPTPTKRIKSVSMLRKKIEQFFEVQSEEYGEDADNTGDGNEEG